MSTKADFDARFARMDTALAAIKAKLDNTGMSAADEDAVLQELETHTVNLETLAQ